jgi:nucleoside-triphosphatase THEP1
MSAAPLAIILTGERGSGKTSVCVELARRSKSFVGLVSPPILDAGGRRVGFSALCLESGRRWELARCDADLGGPRWGRFSFSPEGIGRAVDCLRAALDRGAPVDPLVTVIDEIGPLELQAGAGLAPLLPLLRDAGRLLLVVRPSLVDRVRELLPRHRVEVMGVR